MMRQFLVRLGRTDGTACKTIFITRRKKAIGIANAIGFVLWGVHPFRRSECRELARFEQDGFWMEFITEGEDEPVTALGTYARSPIPDEEHF